MHTLGGKDSGLWTQGCTSKAATYDSLLALVICGSFLLVITLSRNHMFQSVIAGVNGSLPWQPTPHFRDSTLGRTSDRPRSWWDRLRVTWSNFQLTNTQVSSICCINWTLKPQILDPNTWVILKASNVEVWGIDLLRWLNERMVNRITNERDSSCISPWHENGKYIFSSDMKRSFTNINENTLWVSCCQLMFIIMHIKIKIGGSSIEIYQNDMWKNEKSN
jgi:hypothetical protein